MAIGRLRVKVGKAGGAAPHAGYISRVGAYARFVERGEKIEVSDSGNMPAWALDNPLAFWAAADVSERANGTTYREIELALPRELSPAQRERLARDFIAREVGDRHPYQFAIHCPRAVDGGEQPHMHLMFSERQVDGVERAPEQYFRRFNSKNPGKGGARKGWGPSAGQTLTAAERRAELVALRFRWERLANAHLAQAGVGARIDMRSNLARGEGIEAERKLLPSEWRDAATRGKIVELRTARRAHAAATEAVERAVPDVAAEILRLEEERLAREASAAEAITRSVRAAYEAVLSGELVEDEDEDFRFAAALSEAEDAALDARLRPGWKHGGKEAARQAVAEMAEKEACRLWEERLTRVVRDEDELRASWRRQCAKAPRRFDDAEFLAASARWERLAKELAALDREKDELAAKRARLGTRVTSVLEASPGPEMGWRVLSETVSAFVGDLTRKPTLSKEGLWALIIERAKAVLDRLGFWQAVERWKIEKRRDALAPEVDGCAADRAALEQAEGDLAARRATVDADHATAQKDYEELLAARQEKHLSDSKPADLVWLDEQLASSPWAVELARATVAAERRRAWQEKKQVARRSAAPKPAQATETAGEAARRAAPDAALKLVAEMRAARARFRGDLAAFDLKRLAREEAEAYAAFRRQGAAFNAAATTIVEAERKIAAGAEDYAELLKAAQAALERIRETAQEAIAGLEQAQPPENDPYWSSGGPGW